MAHWSSCAVNNGPALPAGPCDCGNDAPNWPDFEQKLKERFPDGITPLETPLMKMLRGAEDRKTLNG